MAADLVIKNGWVVTPTEIFKGGVAISNEKDRRNRCKRPIASGQRGDRRQRQTYFAGDHSMATFTSESPA